MNTEFFYRHKAGLILLLYLSLSLIFLTNRLDPVVMGLKKGIWFLVSPEIVHSGGFFNRLDSLRGRLFRLFRAEGENHILREQVAELSRDDLEKEALERENQRLRDLLNLRQKLFSEAIPAEVVGRDVRDWFHSFVVDKGAKHQVSVSAAVVGGSPEKPALVGRIEEIDTKTSKVLLITDPISAVSVSVAESGDLGLLEGRNQPNVLVRYLSRRSRVKVGDEILTVGLGGVFPPGVPVGKVVKVYKTGEEFFKEAVVEPYLDFGSIQEVLILERKERVQEETE